jgi:hypothetical protein
MLMQHIVTPKRHKELRPRSYTKTHAKNKCPKLYLHNASYTQPVHYLHKDVWCRLPITGIMYSGLRQIAALQRTHFRRDLINSIRIVMLPVASK